MYQWDEEKAKQNAVKHSVTFEFATRIFNDTKRVTVIDNRFDYEETRYIILGKIEKRVYVVVYTLRQSLDDCTITRIISARKANSREVKHYDNN